MTQVSVNTNNTSHQPPNYFYPAVITLFLVALFLRYYQLGKIQTFVFDEIYFANFAHNYLTSTPLFDAHPPLGKYFIALSIELLGFNPFGYRAMNALIGSLIPLLIIALAFRLTRRYHFALFAGIVAFSDGLLLVESRHALLNVYLVFIGLTAHLSFLVATEKYGFKRWLWIIVTAILLGATCGVKWSGLSFITPIYLLWLLARCRKLFSYIQKSNIEYGVEGTLLERVSKVPILALFLCLPLIAFSVYYTIWIPHLKINKDANFVEVHKQIYNFHKSFVNKPEVHAYCSPWYSWPMTLRPVCYYYETTDTPEGKIIYDIHDLGNPFLYWFATFAIILLMSEIIFGLRHYGLHPDLFPLVYIIACYAINLAAWAGVSRFTFIYHYLPAATFSYMAVAWQLDQWFQSSNIQVRRIAMAILVIFIIGLGFWLPIYMGLPLSQTGFQIRMWFPSWI